MATIIIVSVRSEKSREIKAITPEIAAAATSKRVMTSPNWDKKSVNTFIFFCPPRELYPYFARRVEASDEVSPCPSERRLFRTAAAVMRDNSSIIFPFYRRALKNDGCIF